MSAGSESAVFNTLLSTLPSLVNSIDAVLGVLSSTSLGFDSCELVSAIASNV